MNWRRLLIDHTPMTEPNCNFRVQKTPTKTPDTSISNNNLYPSSALLALTPTRPIDDISFEQIDHNGRSPAGHCSYA